MIFSCMIEFLQMKSRFDNNEKIFKKWVSKMVITCAEQIKTFFFCTYIFWNCFHFQTLPLWLQCRLKRIWNKTFTSRAAKQQKIHISYLAMERLTKFIHKISLSETIHHATKVKSVNKSNFKFSSSYEVFSRNMEFLIT